MTRSTGTRGRGVAGSTMSSDFGVDATAGLLEAAAVATRADGHDLRQHRQGGLGRRVRADVESGRAADALEVCSVDAGLEQALAPPLLVAPRAERADVVRLGCERAGEQRQVELVVVGQNED